MFFLAKPKSSCNFLQASRKYEKIRLGVLVVVYCMMSQVFILICIVEMIRLSDSLINCTRIALQVELVFGMGYVLLDYVMMQGKLGPH